MQLNFEDNKNELLINITIKLKIKHYAKLEDETIIKTFLLIRFFN